MNYASDRKVPEMTVGPLNKGLGLMGDSLTCEEIRGKAWNLLREDLSLPTAVLHEDKLAHNLAWMQQFINAYGVKIAPHGKTTMAPKLFALQMQAGAWGITLATAHQTRVAHEHGIRRVLMANQLIGKQNMEVISRMLEDPTFEYFCLVDSAVQVEQLGRFFRTRKQRLNVLIELGVAGGRTGVRDQEQLRELLAALEDWNAEIAIRGIEIYEGVIEDESTIRKFLQHAVEVTHQLVRTNRFDRSPIILSGAGSSWYDVVAEEFSHADIGGPVDVVLRPGCYLTHDVGAYQVAQTRILRDNPVAREMHPGLVPALQLWAYVQSIPEKERAIVALGKRDAAFDSGLPTPELYYRPRDAWPENAGPRACPTAWRLTRMMDQHAYLAISEGDDIQVGDMIGFGISHPCLTFDKWRSLLVLDSSYQVVDVVQTFF